MGGIVRAFVVGSLMAPVLIFVVGYGFSKPLNLLLLMAILIGGLVVFIVVFGLIVPALFPPVPMLPNQAQPERDDGETWTPQFETDGRAWPTPAPPRPAKDDVRGNLARNLPLRQRFIGWTYRSPPPKGPDTQTE